MNNLKSLFRNRTARVSAVAGIITVSLLAMQPAIAAPLPKMKPDTGSISSFTSIGETGTGGVATATATPAAKKIVSRSVVDQANIMDNESEFRLTQALGQFQLERQVQVVVLTTASLRGYDIDKYSAAVSKQWGVAETKEKPGILVVVAPNEKFVKIRVGPGLKEWMPDEVANHLISKFMIPAFAESKWQEGIVRGTAGIIAVMGRDKPIQISETMAATTQNPALSTTSTQPATTVEASTANSAQLTQVAATSPAATASNSTASLSGVLLWPFLMLLLAFAALGLFWYRGRQVEDLASGNQKDLDLA